MIDEALKFPPVFLFGSSQVNTSIMTVQCGELGYCDESQSSRVSALDGKAQTDTLAVGESV